VIVAIDPGEGEVGGGGADPESFDRLGLGKERCNKGGEDAEIGSESGHMGRLDGSAGLANDGNARFRVKNQGIPLASRGASAK
jgi:hypothetical protein